MGNMENRKTMTIKNMEETEKKAEPSDKNKPKIFLSGSIRGGRQLLETYRLMCNFEKKQELN